MTAYDNFLNHIAELSDILNAISILKWDARTQMPHGGAKTRGYQLATLARIAQEHFISDKTLRLMDAAEKATTGESADSYRVRGIRQTRHSYGIIRKIPLDLVTEKAAIDPVSEQVWAEAKANNDFASFAPYLQKQLDLAKRRADVIGYDAHPFDALLLEYEPGMTAAKLRVLFDDLKAGVLPLLKKIVTHRKPLPHVPQKDLWTYEYPQDKQKAFGLEIAQKFGYDLNRGRLDIAPHPFEVSFTRNDVRITTRYHKTFFPMAFFGILHETGHGLYEQGIDPALTRTPLTIDFLGQYAVGGTSYGTHESQSRMWENQIGRSRAFWNVHCDRLREVFPEQMVEADADLMYRLVNSVAPTLIRVEADEVTYNLHIMLRTEIELGLLEDSIKVNDLPEIWTAKMQEYLGVVPPDDRRGVLQDIHWSMGGFGSFPSYTIGNVMSAQFLEAAHRDVPGLQDALAQGEYQPLLGWLTQNIYRHGRAYSSSELLQRTSGSDLKTDAYLRYLTTKYSDIHGLN